MLFLAAAFAGGTGQFFQNGDGGAAKLLGTQQLPAAAATFTGILCHGNFSAAFTAGACRKGGRYAPAADKLTATLTNRAVPFGRRSFGVVGCCNGNG